MSSLLVSLYGPTQNCHEKLKTLATLIIYSESCVVALFKMESICTKILFLRRQIWAIMLLLARMVCLKAKDDLLSA